MRPEYMLRIRCNHPSKFEAFQANIRLRMKSSLRPCHCFPNSKFLHLFSADLCLILHDSDLIRHTEYARSVCVTQLELQTPSLTQKSKISMINGREQGSFDHDNQNSHIHTASREPRFETISHLYLRPSRN
jgi:hypothetical protein